MKASWKLPTGVFIFVLFLLVPVQLFVDNPMLLLERFFPGGGWLQILLIAFYGALVAYKMQDPARVAAWRQYTWLAFSILFFSQLILGLAGMEKFLMTGKLHLPVPMMILAGPLYRGHISVMTILFLSTVVLSGPAWCSHLCYFGALDSVITGRKISRQPIRWLWTIKWTLLLLVIVSALMLRGLKVDPLSSTLLAGSFGVAGLGIMLILSRRKGKMIHCTTWCPIGTIVSYARLINPFRLSIERNSCNTCMACSLKCKYDALNKKDILSGKPGSTCTLCGDCIASCHSGAIRYRFPGLSANGSRNLYLLITVSLHAATMALARI